MRNAIILGISTAFAYANQDLSCFIVDGEVKCSTLLNGRRDFIVGNHTEWRSREHIKKIKNNHHE